MLPSAIDQTASIDINQSLSTVAVEANNATSSSLSSASSSSSSLASLALNAAPATETNDGSYANESNLLLQPSNDQLHPQTLSLSRATELIRQRSSSIHHIHNEDRIKLTQQQQQEYDDEVALHPLSNQVSTFAEWELSCALDVNICAKCNSLSCDNFILFFLRVITISFAK